MKPIIIIGTGLAGYTLAKELRKLDKDTPLVMFSADDGTFYSKPMLSNALAQGRTPDALASASAEKMATDLNATIHVQAPVDDIDTQHRLVHHAGCAQPYSQLVIASGARPIRLPLKGNAANQVMSINNLQDYRTFRDQLREGDDVAIIGPGLIGCEFANDLLEAGHRCQVIGPDAWPISTLLPEIVGERLREALAACGVEWHLRNGVTHIDRDGNGYRLQLQQGKPFHADLVLSAIGLRADTRLAEKAGLKIERGIAVDRLLRSNDPMIYALGDCAQVAGHYLPFVMPIMHAARALAKTLAGQPTEVHYPAMPVVVKTPACPIAVAPPPRDASGEWCIDSDADGIAARYLAADGRLLGFALCGAASKQRMALARVLPPML